MSLKNENLTRAYRLMHARGVTTSVLAERLHTSRAHVSLVLSGRRRKGRTWDRVRDYLTDEEVALLQVDTCSTGNIDSANANRA